ncbi:MAG: hypothetical protein H6815_04640 [Phycisphaeraceae bacterium]|nr:hypothetical protein [Phycisphaerales bacterium]MCB9859721.1 hypothetical protein [Phycisphaeraceae bacterium]
MKTKPMFLAVALSATAAVAGPGAVTINFDVYPGPDGVLGTPDDVPIAAPTTFNGQAEQLTNQYASVGILFTPSAPINDQNEILDAASFNTPASHTPPNLLASSGSLPIEATFTTPVIRVSALVGISGGADTLEAYDANGTLIAAIQGDDTVVTIDVGVEIARIRVVATVSTTPAIDNLTFEVDAGCYADCDGSGALNIFDYICFGNEYAAGTSYADCDGSGQLNIFDYICFGNEYAAGCP